MITILFYPEPLTPTPLSRIYRVLQEQGKENNITYHSDFTKHYDLHFFWSYTKFRIEPDTFTLTEKNVINRGCWNIDKEKVNDVFNDIRIDPTIHEGRCVEKCNLQGKHSRHSIITCPAPKREGYIYQEYIEHIEDGQYVKYRVYFADGIKVILKSYKPTPFGSECTKHIEIDKRELFTEAQEKQFLIACKCFGIDFGEIDIMLDEGTPIIVDVNNCVGGGFVWGLTGTEVHKRIDTLFIEFIKQRYEAKKWNEGKE